MNGVVRPVIAGGIVLTALALSPRPAAGSAPPAELEASQDPPRCGAAELWQQASRDAAKSSAKVRAEVAYEVAEAEKASRHATPDTAVWKACKRSIIALLEWIAKHPPSNTDLERRARDALAVAEREHLTTAAHERAAALEEGPVGLRYKGTGLLIAGGVSSATAFSIRFFFSVSMAGDNAFDIVSISALADAISAGPALAGFGFLAGGMHLRAKAQAYSDVFKTDALTTRIVHRPVLGWGLFGGAAALYATTILIAVFGCKSIGCVRGVWDTGWYTSYGLGTAGLVIGQYGKSYRRWESHYQIQLTGLTPFVVPGGGGLRIGLQL